MRLMKSDEKELIHLRPVERESDYIGTATELSEVGTLRGTVNPVTDKISAEIYGNRINGMISLTLLTPHSVVVGDVLRYMNEAYRVLSIAHYQSHDIITAERVKTDGA